MNKKISTGVGIVVIVIVAAIISAVLWFMGGSQTQTQIQPTQSAQTNSLKGQIGNQSQTTKNLTKVDQISKNCTKAPEASEMGGNIYPVDDKYKQMEFLGQLFTAYNCGPERLKKIFGGDDYTLGSSLSLKNLPSEEFIKILNSTGFECSEKNIDKNCTNWELSKTVKIKELLKIIPFADEIKSDDCVICG